MGGRTGLVWILVVALLLIVFTHTAGPAVASQRYFKAEHGLSATYLRLSSMVRTK